MPTVDFYILPDADSAARLRLACCLTEKAYQQKQTIYIHAENRAMAHQLDECLWTWRDDSFLPHHLVGDGPEPPPPIQIGFDAIPDKSRHVLINLHPEVPAFYSRFARIMELIVNEPTAQEAGRERYRFYRTTRLEINTHKLQTIEI